MQDAWHTMRSWTAEDYSSLASWLTAIIALIAGVIAYRQVREARRLRIEQAQPYVVAYMDQSVAASYLIDLVIRNFGTTLALDVTVASSPTLKRSTQTGATEDVWLFERMPALAPGQEWRTFWDASHERFKTDLPEKYDVVISYRDSQGKEHKIASALDWGAHRQRMFVQLYEMHHAAKALREIKQEIAKWKEFSGGLKVVARNGDRRDKRRREEHEAFERATAEAEQEANATTPRQTRASENETRNS
jgi:hypothetical protein